MELQTALNDLKKLQLEMHAYGAAQSSLYLDGATVGPRGGAAARGQAMGILSEKSYQLFVCDKTRELLAYLKEQDAQLDPVQRRQVELLSRDLEQVERIPVDEYAAYAQLQNDSENAWHEAKENNDYASFRPYLDKVLEFNRRFAGYKDAGKPAYDCLLDDYERGMSTATLDPFFETLKKTLVPLVKEVKDRPIDDSFLFSTFDEPRQAKLAAEMMQVMGLTPDFCALGTTEHPFTLGFNRYDVRITTHYYEHALPFSLYSVIHEGGHALYEHGIADEYQYTSLADAASMGLHESQSRFYENIIGRSRAFVEGVVYPAATRLYPDELKGVTPEMLYRAVNKAQPSLIRTEADELTYCLHIMIRYELEKQLVAGTLSTADLPGAWNQMYKDMLGIVPPDDKQGVLQDMHWSGGMIGYFPTYALGSAYGAQFLHVMSSELDVDALAGKGELTPITAWLREHIHRHGHRYDPAELIQRVCGEPFNPKYYTDYLTRKMTEVYGL